ncbi:MAG: hypothetical protein V4651_02540 [Bacteroidota bacterium]
MHKLFASVLFLILFSANAQRVDLQLGAALPSGDFGNNDLSKNENAFATNGYTLGLQADYPVYKNMGIVAKLNYSTFGFNESSYQTQFNKQLPPGTSAIVESNDGYSCTSALAGGFMTLGKKKLTLDIRLMTGFLTLTNSGLSYTTSYAGQEYKQRNFSETDAAIAFGWGLTTRYVFTNRLYLSLNLDNVYANTNFRKNEYQSSSEETVSKPYQTYLMSIGLGYDLQ